MSRSDVQLSGREHLLPRASGAHLQREGVKHFLHVSALQQNLKHRSEWARTKVGYGRIANG